MGHELESRVKQKPIFYKRLRRETDSSYKYTAMKVTFLQNAVAIADFLQKIVCEKRNVFTKCCNEGRNFFLSLKQGMLNPKPTF